MVQAVLKNTYRTSILYMYCPNNSVIIYVNGGKDTLYTKDTYKHICLKELLESLINSEEREGMLHLNDSIYKENTRLKMVFQ